MRLVVADTSPLFYLLSIGQLDLLPQLFGRVLVPDAVSQELSHAAAPTIIREWANHLPSWVEVKRVEPLEDAAFAPLGAGERAAITLALSQHADLILIDARRGLIDLADSFRLLKRTNFRYRQEIMDALLHRRT